MKEKLSVKRTPKAKLHKVTWEAIVTITDDGSDGSGGVLYLSHKQIKDLLMHGARYWSGVKVRVGGIMELPRREDV